MGRGLTKLRMPRMFAVSFLSCRLRNDAYVISDQRRQVGSRDIPTSGEIPTTFRQIESGRRRVEEADAQTPRPPPTSPIQTIHAAKKKTTTMTSTTKTKMSTESSSTTLPTTTASSTDSPCFFTTDEEEVSLRRTSLKHPSFSNSDSDSESDIFSIPRRSTSKRRSTTTRRRNPRYCTTNDQSSASKKKLPAMARPGGKVEESVAVTKRSTDPYADFRSSMAEMIVEKELLTAEELFQLLDCFLSLNSHSYHRIIIAAFEEICEALFKHWC